MAENFPNLVKDESLSPKKQINPKRIHLKNSTEKHIIVKLSKTKNKRKRKPSKKPERNDALPIGNTNSNDKRYLI